METSDKAARPTPPAMAAFGVDAGALSQLPGGQGLAWSDGRVVLKPAEYGPAQNWVCDVYASWTAHDLVRVPEPIAAAAGDENEGETRWIVDWAAHVYVAGRDVDLPREISVVREVSEDFHDVVAALPRPDWLDDRDDPWSYGDRLAWEDAAALGHPHIGAVVDRLRTRWHR
jgi:hypothetical protein